MLDRDTILTLFETNLQGLVYNLDFIPTEKLNWKPAPTANSALEIANHLGAFVNSVGQRLNPETPAFVPATNADEAKQALIQVGERFCATVRAASPALLGELFRDEMPLTNGWIVTACAIDVMHHGGQIAYLQTLLGDTEVHFDAANAPDFAIG